MIHKVTTRDWAFENPDAVAECQRGDFRKPKPNYKRFPPEDTFFSWHKVTCPDCQRKRLIFAPGS